MKAYVVQQCEDCETLATMGVFSTREGALDFLNGRTTTIYRHCGMRDGWRGLESYSEWNTRSNTYCPYGVYRDKIVQIMEIGITEADGRLGYHTPDGKRLRIGYDYRIDEFEVDHADV